MVWIVFLILVVLMCGAAAVKNTAFTVVAVIAFVVVAGSLGLGGFITSAIEVLACVLLAVSVAYFFLPEPIQKLMWDPERDGGLKPKKKESKFAARKHLR
ncbi:hypothetical protein RA28_04565 [Ruegeria sp. ANG-S4]|uniref:hypothetical protein n=1 Tax=Ruegeria sp. ANG-S4 TaxID=1577904 RepID=UPI00057EA190|nr:hypothetical protein [Ruegeria sp. ANG-S4]KIC46995.1 hypothetical protein RA28_04565 [Ruegeria sp. ANG-S4]